MEILINLFLFFFTALLVPYLVEKGLDFFAKKLSPDNTLGLLLTDARGYVICGSFGLDNGAPVRNFWARACANLCRQNGIESALDGAQIRKNLFAWDSEKRFWADANGRKHMVAVVEYYGAFPMGVGTAPGQKVSWTPFSEPQADISHIERGFDVAA